MNKKETTCRPEMIFLLGCFDHPPSCKQTLNVRSTVVSEQGSFTVPELCVLDTKSERHQ